MGNPLLDISAVVDDEFLTKYALLISFSLCICMYTLISVIQITIMWNVQLKAYMCDLIRKWIDLAVVCVVLWLNLFEFYCFDWFCNDGFGSEHSFQLISLCLLELQICRQVLVIMVFELHLNVWPVFRYSKCCLCVTISVAMQFRLHGQPVTYVIKCILEQN